MTELTKTIIVFGSLSVIILILFQLEKWSLFSLGGSERIYLIISGTLFLILGIIISRFFYFKMEKRSKEQVQSSLSKQELKVLRLIAEGKSNKEIGELLHIAESTVKSHVSNILSKLNAKRRTEAIKIGIELKIL